MRIGTKLLLTYLLLIGVLGLTSTLLLPHWVRTIVISTEEQRLDKQALVLADRMAGSLQARGAGDPRSIRATFSLAEALLTDEDIAIVDPTGRVLVGTRPALMDVLIPREYSQTVHERPQPLLQHLPELKGLGRVILASAPLGARPPLADFSLVIIRDMTFVQSLAGPLALRLNLVIVLVLAAATVVAAWLSRDLVLRIKSTGAAARALADGDLAHRAPERGHDEITELAGHFNHMAERIQALVSRLRRSEHARKDLLVMVSHELRTPMTSISGFAEALRDGVVQQEDRKQRYYQIIATESGRLNRLVNDLFDMAKLEAGQSELNLQALSATPWLVEFAEAALPAAEAAGVQLVLEVSPEAERSRIYGDRDRLDQVLANLTGNAVRFTPGGETVMVRARVDAGYLVVAVSDRGPGLAPDEAERVFDRFFQGSNQVRDHNGAGLGLSIVKTLVEAHGGTVGVETAPGVGATFWFRLRVLGD